MIEGNDTETIFRQALCCACNSKMQDSPHVNIALTDKKAEWEKPVAGNILLKNVYANVPRAIAVVCDKCAELEKPITKVIEFADNKIRYRDIDSLQDTFRITEDMLQEDVHFINDNINIAVEAKINEEEKGQDKN